VAGHLKSLLGSFGFNQTDSAPHRKIVLIIQFFLSDATKNARHGHFLDQERKLK